MTLTTKPIFAATALLTGLMSACAMMPADPQAATILAAKSGSAVSGEVRFSQIAGGVHVQGRVQGLKANQEHGFHVHEKGDCSSADGLSAGGHFNPEGKAHGHHTAAAHHAGDMPNLKADAQGVAQFDFVLKALSVTDAKIGVVGRSVIVHVNPDDYTSQPVGNAGGRIACGVIAASK